MPQRESLASHIMAVPALIFMFFIDILISAYNILDNFTLKFEAPPDQGRRRRRPDYVANAVRRVIHFILQVIELPVFLVVFIVTAVLLTILAVIEIVLGAILVKFRYIVMAALLITAGYLVYTGVIKLPIKK